MAKEYPSRVEREVMIDQRGIDTVVRRRLSCRSASIASGSHEQHRSSGRTAAKHPVGHARQHEARHAATMRRHRDQVDAALTRDVYDRVRWRLRDDEIGDDRDTRMRVAL